MPTIEAKLKAVESVNKTGEYLFLIGLAHQKIGDNKGALEYYQQVTERQELNNFLASQIATAYQGIGDYSSALKYIDESISLEDVYKRQALDLSLSREIATFVATNQQFRLYDEANHGSTAKPRLLSHYAARSGAGHDSSLCTRHAHLGENV